VVELIYFSKDGVPQSDILSPILSNIYLTNLDKFIKNTIIPKYTKGDKAEVNKKYINSTTVSEEREK
jgi:retron-type reverse transcriptase